MVVFGFYYLWWCHCGGLGKSFFFLVFDDAMPWWQDGSLVRLNGGWLGIWWCRRVVMWDSWWFWVFGSTDFVCWWYNTERELNKLIKIGSYFNILLGQFSKCL